MVIQAYIEQPSLSDQFAAEQAQVNAGTATACTFTCVDHGGHVCERVTAHNGPHVAHQADGSLIQWAPPCLTADQIAQAEQDATALREAATHQVMATLDPALLVQLLIQGGYVVPSTAPTPPPATP